MKSGKTHRLISFERVILTGAVNFIRNIWLSIAAIAMMTITLTILLFAVVANATFSHTIDQITKNINVSVYLKDNVNDKQRNDLTDKIKAFQNVASVEYISKSRALQIYQAENKDNPELLAAINETSNPLPASLRIQPIDPNKLEPLKQFLDRAEITALQSDPTSYSGSRKDAIDKITNATHFFEQAGIAGILAFLAISVLIIFNTIRMAIFNRRDELVIMRLLGASPWYIRGPFVVETVLFGIVAALLSILICKGIFAVASNTLEASSLGLLDISYSEQYFNGHFLTSTIGLLLIGIILGAVSSIIATRRYLKIRN